jgi:putative nucleotidyltransferase with HDIG domain
VSSIFRDSADGDEKLRRIADRIDVFELYSGPHSTRVADLADRLGEAFNLASRDRNYLHKAALLHDIGELAMNRDYIAADRKLTDTEVIDLRRHPVIGEQEAAKLDLPRGVQLIIRWHHEWWNGWGYPDGLSGQEIPLTARLLRVADGFASLTSKRPYREAFPVGDARKHLAEMAGIEYDPEAVFTLLSILSNDERMAAEASGRLSFEQQNAGLQ